MRREVLENVSTELFSIASTRMYCAPRTVYEADRQRLQATLLVTESYSHMACGQPASYKAKPAYGLTFRESSAYQCQISGTEAQ